jgi:hypothetical protein
MASKPQLLEPVVRHHRAVLQVVVAVGPVERREFQVEAEAPGGGLQHAQALGHHFLADAVAGDHGNPMGHVCGS